MAETWIIKSSATGEFATTQISFTSNGQKFTSIGATYTGLYVVLCYDNTEVAGYDPGSGDMNYMFDPEAYRKLTFDAPPTGALLTWLQANATRQVVEYLTTDADLIKVANAIRAKSGTTAKLSFPDGFALEIGSIPSVSVQPSKALTITSNGTVSVTPDAPYDALKKADVTVDVASGGGTETTSVDVYGRSETIDMPIFCTWQTANGWLGTSEFELTNSNGDFLFTIPDVLVGGYIVFTKDPMNQALFNVARGSGVESLDVNPMPSSGDTANASTVVKVVEPGANFVLWVSSA